MSSTLPRAARALPLLLLACGPKATTPEAAPAQEAPRYELVSTKAFIGELEVSDFQWDNGLRLLVVPDHAAPVVAYQTWYGVGSSDEQLGKTGLAHLFEHMMFKATKDYGEGEYMKRLDGLGASGLNAWTWLDETVYVQSVPVQALPTLAAMERARMTGLVLDQAQLDSEREVVINERRLRVDNDPDGKLDEALWGEAFQSHRYGWPTVGWEVDLNGLTVEDCVSFYETWYAPNNATIILVGDIEPAEAAALIDAEYGGLAASDIPDQAQPPEPAREAQRRVELELPVSTDRLMVGFPMPAASDPDAPAARVLDAILTSGRTGRLKRALQDTGVAGSVGSYAYPMQEDSLIVLTATAREGATAAQLEGLLFAELATLVTEGVTQQELDRGVNQVLASTWAELESGSGKASFMGWALTTAGDWSDGVEELDALRALTTEDIQRVAAELLVVERSTVAHGLAAGGPRASTLVASAVAAPEAGAPIEARAPAGPVADPGFRATKALHGATLILDHDPALPLLDLQIGWKTGSAYAPPGVANLAAKMLLRGPEARSREAFEEAVEGLGASLSVDVQPDRVTLHARVLADTWPQFMALLSEALLTPAYEAAELELLKEEVDNQLLEALDDDAALADRAFLAALYGADHPYGVGPLGTREALDDVTMDQLKAFRATWLGSGGAVVGLAGAFDAQAAADLEALLGELHTDAPAQPQIAAPEWPEEPLVIVIDKPERSQVQVVMGGPGVAYQSGDYPAWYLANQAWGGGGFTSQLTKAVRVERGWSYFAYSYSQGRVHTGPFRIRLAPGSEYAVDAVRLVTEMMAAVDAEGISSEELDQMRSAELLSAPFLADTAPKRLGWDVRRALTGYDPLAYNAVYEGVTLDQANAAFSAHLEPGRTVLVVVATASDVAEGLAAFGEVTVVPFAEVE